MVEEEDIYFLEIEYRTEDRVQRTEDRGQRTEDRGHDTYLVSQWQPWTEEGTDAQPSREEGGTGGSPTAALLGVPHVQHSALTSCHQYGP